MHSVLSDIIVLILISSSISHYVQLLYLTSCSSVLSNVLDRPLIFPLPAHNIPHVSLSPLCPPPCPSLWYGHYHLEVIKQL